MAQFRVKTVSTSVNVYLVEGENIDMVFDQYDDDDLQDWVLVDSYPDTDQDIDSVTMIEDDEDLRSTP